MPEACDPTLMEGAVEGRSDNWGEVVTRQPYRKVRLDHLLSKDRKSKGCIIVDLSKGQIVAKEQCGVFWKSTDIKFT